MISLLRFIVALFAAVLIMIGAASLSFTLFLAKWWVIFEVAKAVINNHG